VLRANFDSSTSWHVTSGLYSLATPAHFIPGLELSRALYDEAVAPLLAKHYPGLVHSAGRLDSGSDVLGFDTERSMDHWWGPRVTIFLRDGDDTEELRAEITRMLGMELPFEIRGFPTHMQVENAATNTVYFRQTNERPINHLCQISTTRQFTSAYLGINILDRPLLPREWLVLAEQHLRTIRTGGVWHDGTGELSQLRLLLHWYPDQVWRYLLKAQWRRISQEEAFPGRCAEVDDELGSRVVAARLVRELMHLAFLIEQEYMPYSKWLGTAFSRLACAAELQPVLLDILAATEYPRREQALSAAYEIVAQRFNALRLCDPVPDRTSPFWDRPFQVIHGDRFAAALDATLDDPDVKALPPYFGNTTQWADSTDVLWPRWAPRLSGLYVGL